MQWLSLKPVIIRPYVSPVADPRGGGHGAMAPPPNHPKWVFNVHFLISFQRYFWIRLLI